jgi:hypothetical protein
VFGALMRAHYDPLYLKSIQNNYAQVGAARALLLRDGSDAALREAAAMLLSEQTTATAENERR